MLNIICSSDKLIEIVIRLNLFYMTWRYNRFVKNSFNIFKIIAFKEV